MSGTGLTGVPSPTWTPDPAETAASRISDFAGFVARRTGVTHADYAALWEWSVTDVPGFWSAVWDYFRISSDTPYGEVLDETPMPETRWFPGTRVNYAEHALRADLPGAAIISVNEDGTEIRTSWSELRRQVGSVANWLRVRGVTAGDRVVGYLPNTTHAVVAFLATASIGAVWSACGQDYAASGAAARFTQLEPVVLFAADGYRWNGRTHDRREETDRLRAAVPSLRHVVTVPVVGLAQETGEADSWAVVSGGESELMFERMPFDSPLWVLFSSGTTGVPKGIVHGHGGVLLEHHKLLGLHLDLRPGERFLWYTTTNWMMWNIVVSALLVGSTVVLYDGSPAHPDPGRLWQLAAEHRAVVLGVSPGYLHSSARAELEPGRKYDLSSLKILGSTGAPLTAQPYEWVHANVGSRVQVVSVTGGTDVVSAFAGSAPTTPVWAGEISAPALGAAVDSWDAEGRSVVGEVGELVVTRPMPSMPVYFWNDPDGTRYREAYFDMYPGVWRHGDWVTRTPHGSLIVSGRSDATLNRHGVRLGSSDVYAAIDSLPGIQESLVVGAELPDGDYWMPLFIVLDEGAELDDAMRALITEAVRTGASPRHVPDTVIAVPALPHTRTGKKMEVPVKRILQGAAVEMVANRQAVDDFDALAYFSRFGPRRERDEA
ncbi:acetoacetate--CoA ligase (plasmid) [Streptomyces sp. NBC_00015]|uniref:acetoacetate--CoA ligase n=1 Tax=Streptomyces sp. NBC_00015 TaxID=2903611 RepID=UPI002F91282F